MRIFITGINGYIGRKLAARLRAAGFWVRGSAREPRQTGVIRWSLGDNMTPGSLEGYDILIHAAWSLEDAKSSVNHAGTRSLIDQAKTEGVGRQIFISSHSAQHDAPTTYGATKFATEAAFTELAGGLVLRPGLVIGQGGLFWKLHQWAGNWKVIPLLADGKFDVPVIGIDDLATALLQLIHISTDQKRVWALYDPRVPDQRTLVRAICAAHGWKRVLLPIPTAPSMLLLRTADMIKINLPIRSANLRAALANRSEAHRSDLLSLVPKPFSLDTCIRLAIDEGAAAQSHP